MYASLQINPFNKQKEKKEEKKINFRPVELNTKVEC